MHTSPSVLDKKGVCASFTRLARHILFARDWFGRCHVSPYTFGVFVFLSLDPPRTPRNAHTPPFWPKRGRLASFTRLAGRFWFVFVFICTRFHNWARVRFFCVRMALVFSFVCRSINLTRIELSFARLPSPSPTQSPQSPLFYKAMFCAYNTNWTFPWNSRSG